MSDGRINIAIDISEEELKKSLNKTSDILSTESVGLTSMLSDAILNGLKPIVDKISKIFTGIGGFISQIISGDFSENFDFQKILDGEISNVEVSEIDCETGLFSSFFSKTESEITEDVPRIFQGLNKILDIEMDNSKSGIVANFKNLFSDNNNEFLETGKKIISSIGGAVTESTPNLKNTVATISDFFTNNLDTVPVSIKDVIKSGLGKAFEGINVDELSSDVLNQLKNLFSITLPSNVEEAIVNVKNAIANKESEVSDSVVTIFTNILGKFSEYAPNFSTGGESLITSLSSGVKESIPNVVLTTGEVIKEVLNEIKENLPNMLKSGTNMISNFAQGIADEVGLVKTNTKDIVTNGMLSTINGFCPDFIDNGKKVLTNLIEGIKEKEQNVKIAIESVGDIIRDTCSSVSLFEVGKDIINGLKDGILQNASKVKDAVYQVGSSITDTIKNQLGIHSPSRVMKEIGEHTGAGLALGIDNNVGVVKKSIRAMGNELVDEANSVLHNNGSSTKVFNALGAYIAKDVTNGLEEKEAIKTIDTLENEVIKSTKQWIDEYKGDIVDVTKFSIKTWQSVLDNYELSGSEILSVQSEINNQMQKLNKAEFEKSMSWIEAKKDANELSMIEEYKAWQRIQSRYAVGTKERVQADNELAKSHKKILNRENQLMQEISLADSLNDETLKQGINEELESLMAISGEDAGKSFATSLIASLKNVLIETEGFGKGFFGGLSSSVTNTNSSKSNIFNISIDTNNLKQVSDVVEIFNNLETAYNAY